MTPKIQKFLILLFQLTLIASYLSVNLFNIDPFFILTTRLFSALIMISIFISNWKDGFRPKSIDVFTLCFLMIGSVFSFVSLNLLFIFGFVFTVRNVNFDYIINATVLSLGSSVLFIFGLLYFGIIENSIEKIGSASDSELIRDRATAGFNNVNAFSGLVIAFLFVLLLRKKSKWMANIFALIISIATFQYTDSRTVIYSTLIFQFFLCSSYILSRKPQFQYLFSVACILTPVFITVFAAYFNQFLPMLDVLLSYRLLYVAAFLTEIPWFSWVIGGASPPVDITVDNSFALLLGALGVPVFIIFIHRTLNFMHSCIQLKEYRIYAFVVSFWFLIFSESHLVRPETLIALIFWLALSKIDVKYLPGYKK